MIGMDESETDKWIELIKPIEKATGWKCYGFDPGFILDNPQGTATVSLPKSFVEDFNKRLKEV